MAATPFIKTVTRQKLLKVCQENLRILKTFVSKIMAFPKVCQQTQTHQPVVQQSHYPECLKVLTTLKTI